MESFIFNHFIHYSFYHTQIFTSFYLQAIALPKSPKPKSKIDNTTAFHTQTTHKSSNIQQQIHKNNITTTLSSHHQIIRTLSHHITSHSTSQSHTPSPPTVLLSSHSNGSGPLLTSSAHRRELQHPLT